MRTATCLALLPLLLGLTARAAPPPAQLGVVGVAGTDLVRLGSDKPQPLKAGDRLLAGDRLQTGKDPAILVLHEGSISAAVKLKPGTVVSLSNEPGQGLRTTVERGGVLSDVHNPEKKAHPYEIRTRTAVMGVRGTVFFVKETPGESVFLCACHGRIGVKPASERKTSASEALFEGTHHDHPVLIREKVGAPIAPRATPAPMGDEHSDAEAAELEKMLSSLK